MALDAQFTAILQTLIAEQGKQALTNPAKCRAFLPDYTKSEYTKERRLLFQVVEAGTAKALDSAADVELCKKQQARHLQEELFMTEESAIQVVTILALVLRGDTSTPSVQPRQASQPKPRTSASPAPATPPTSRTQHTGMALVPAGTFMMGSNKCDWEKPVHRVTISTPFYMSKYLVTQKEWQEVMGTTIAQQWTEAGGSGSPSYGVGDNYPMYYVSWYEAIEYCNKLSVKEGLEPAYSGSGDAIQCKFKARGIGCRLRQNGNGRRAGAARIRLIISSPEATVLLRSHGIMTIAGAVRILWGPRRLTVWGFTT
jgi:hypothetical protein